MTIVLSIVVISVIVLSTIVASTIMLALLIARPGDLSVAEKIGLDSLHRFSSEISTREKCEAKSDSRIVKVII